MSNLEEKKNSKDDLTNLREIVVSIDKEIKPDDVDVKQQLNELSAKVDFLILLMSSSMNGVQSTVGKRKIQTPSTINNVDAFRFEGIRSPSSVIQAPSTPVVFQDTIQRSATPKPPALSAPKSRYNKTTQFNAIYTKTPEAIMKLIPDDIKKELELSVANGGNLQKATYQWCSANAVAAKDVWDMLRNMFDSAKNT